MNKYHTRENERINYLLLALYNKGNWGAGFLEGLLEQGGFEIPEESEGRALINKMRFYGLIEMHLYSNEEQVPFYYRNKRIQLTDKGIKAIEEHKNYFNFLKNQKLSKAQRKIDSILKNTTGIIAIGSTIATCILAILSGIDKKDQETLKEELRRASKATDSLTQVVNSQQKRLDTLQAKQHQKP